MPPGSGPDVSRWLLLVDDDPQMLLTLRYYFERRGFSVEAAESVNRAKLRFRERDDWSLVIADYHLPDGNGWDFYCWIRELTPSPRFLLVSGAVGPDTIPGHVDFLAKPFSLQQLERRVGLLLERRP